MNWNRVYTPATATWFTPRNALVLALAELVGYRDTETAHIYGVYSDTLAA